MSVEHFMSKNGYGYVELITIKFIINLRRHSCGRLQGQNLRANDADSQVKAESGSIKSSCSAWGAD